MAPIILVCRGRGRPGSPATGPPPPPFQPVVTPMTTVLRRSRRSELAFLGQGVDIALAYFNSDNIVTSSLTAKARNWADRYFQGASYAANRPTALLQWYSNLFNLDVEGHIRLLPKEMPSPTPELVGASPKQLLRNEQQDLNSEPFPEFAEPTLASEADIDAVVDLRTAKAKPDMRVDATMLRSSGLLNTLPEFIGQLARANLEMETMLANDPDALRFELDEEEAATRPHVEMNLFGGVVEDQGRKRQGGDDSADDEDSGDDESGNETDSSTSTSASHRVNIRKRKASAQDDSDSDSDTTTPK
ncbi:hypothetical protein N0V88_001173 [Collariella sp. IMI 366227]|nr:hypothetical protein N0V88_001173 [Collariella sp. IMI 366227]